MTGTAAISVVVPTIGRPELLAQCLESLGRCEPRAAEILVVDQSGGTQVAETVGRYAAIGARVVPCEGRGTARARNLGLSEAGNDLVLFTDDDCTVATTWVGVAAAVTANSVDGTHGILTGRVLPSGDSARVPSTNADPEPHDFTGKMNIGALLSGNMAASRTELLALGGFDERFGSMAEDLDLCYRWLRSGGRLRYEPSLVVWHHDWRSDEQLTKHYQHYWRGMGVFYAKHLRDADPTVMRLFAQTLFRIARGTVRRFVKRPSRARSTPPRLAREFASGLQESWSLFDRDGRPPSRIDGSRDESQRTAA
jgi:O-antigen biosynthesis protein